MNASKPAFPDARHNHDACVQNALDKAERVCAERGMNLTAQRRRILELVWASHRPVGAYDILEAMSADGKRYAPPTVYRALEFLIEAGLVHRLDSLNAYVGCPDPTHAHSGQFLICAECRCVLEISDTAIQTSIREHATKLGFEAESVGLEVQGLCSACRHS